MFVELVSATAGAGEHRAGKWFCHQRPIDVPAPPSRGPSFRYSSRRTCIPGGGNVSGESSLLSIGPVIVVPSAGFWSPLAPVEGDCGFIQYRNRPAIPSRRHPPHQRSRNGVTSSWRALPLWARSVCVLFASDSLKARRHALDKCTGRRELGTTCFLELMVECGASAARSELRSSCAVASVLSGGQTRQEFIFFTRAFVRRMVRSAAVYPSLRFADPDVRRSLGGVALFRGC